MYDRPVGIEAEHSLTDKVVLMLCSPRPEAEIAVHLCFAHKQQRSLEAPVRMHGELRILQKSSCWEGGVEGVGAGGGGGEG